MRKMLGGAQDRCEAVEGLIEAITIVVEAKMQQRFTTVDFDLPRSSTEGPSKLSVPT